jgi:hypothetical protein
MGAARAPAAAVVAVVLGVLAVLLVVTWSASIGPGAVLTGDGPTADRVSTTPTPSDTARGPGGPASGPPDRPLFSVQPLVGLLLVVAGTLLAVGLVAAARLGLDLDRAEPITVALRRWRRRRRRTSPDPPFPVLDADRLRQAVARGAAGQRAALFEGTPRNAVVECWHRFEQQAAESGLARHPAETSSEFILRALELVHVDSSAVLRFAALYREARFSDHPLGEDRRAEAVAILDRIHDDLRTGPAGAGPVAPGQGGAR